MSKKKSSAIIYEEFYLGAQALPLEIRGEAYDAYCRWTIYGEEYTGDNIAISVLLASVAKKVESANANYKKKVEHIHDVNEKNKSLRNEAQDSTTLNNTVQDCPSMSNTVSDSDSDTVTASVSENESANEHPTDAKKKRARKHGKYQHVRLTDEQYQELVDEHGEADTEAAIQKVDDYCEETGKTYKNYALVIKRWGYKAAKEDARSGTTERFNATDYLMDIINGEDTS